MEKFLRGLPKAELHLHIEGTLEPEMAFAFARRNGVTLPFDSVEDLRAAYDFSDLQSFLDLYYTTAAVLRTEQDFFDLTTAYLQRAAADGVRRAEVFVDPQAHLPRGVALADLLGGVSRALDEGRADLGVSGGIIVCFLRDRPADEAMRVLDDVLACGVPVLGVGLDSAEIGNPPERFATVFSRARQAGLRAVAHAGEEGPPDYVRQALDLLGVERVDHGVRAAEDVPLVERLARQRVPLTVCPVSNVRLGVVDRLENHVLPALIDAGLPVCLNSDDPAYFGGYIGDVYVRTHQALALTRQHMVAMARTSLTASFGSDAERRRLLTELESYVDANG